jgi:hypothetical protein
MSTATTDTFQSTCDQIIADALTNLGALGPGKTPTGNQRSHAQRALNRLVKSIDASGDFLWRTARRTIAITAGTASYGPSVLGTDVLGLEDPCNFVLTGATNRTIVSMMSNEDFRSLADRTTTGTPSQYLVERTLAGLTLTLWPVPNAAGSLEVMAALRAKDMTAGTQTPDYGSKWDQCLVLGLTGLLAPSYGQASQVKLWTPQFEAERDRLLNDDNEKGPMTLVPWGMYGSYSGVD